MSRLTKTQQNTLRQAAQGYRISYHTRNDTTMNALSKRGFAEWCSHIGQKYGKSHWWITDAGVSEGKKILID